MLEFLKRIRIAIAILVGYGCGRFAADAVGQHWSEVFSGMFLLGVLSTQWLLGKLQRFIERV